ncbi:hypothetical protein [Agrobacterium sp. M50-1]|uniref:hypothetical protein n=1 Tax=Agrobacterium sp. M50-1 TaxID=3132821 RepID=UPI003CE561B1
MNQNLPVALSTLTREISVLTEKLQPINDDQAGVAFRRLLMTGLSLPASMDAAKAPAIYAFALRGISSDGLTRAVEKVIRGEYENLNRAFMPTPPELAALARGEERTLVNDLVRLKDKREALTAKPVEKDRSPEVMARVRALRQKAKQELQSPSQNVPTSAPMTDEQAAYWAKINSMVDANNVSAEQRAFRGKIAADLQAHEPAPTKEPASDIEF